MHRRHTVNVPLSAENVSGNSLSSPRNPSISQSRDCCDDALSKHWQGSVNLMSKAEECVNLMSKAEELGVVNFNNPSLYIKEFSDACKPACRTEYKDDSSAETECFLALSKTESSVDVGGNYTARSLLISTC